MNMVSVIKEPTTGSAGDSHNESDKAVNNLLARRLSKILDTRLENDKDTLEALKELSSFFTENTLKARRNLRSKIEKRSLAINEDFLSSFREVKEALDAIHNDVSAMNDAVQNMTDRLKATKTRTQQLIDQTTKLQSDSQKLTLQQKMADAFLRSFQLSSSEQTVLRDGAITEEFFSALERVQSIHGSCRTLMQSGHQTAALQIMEQMALYQEAALERLYRWAQNNCRSIESPEISLLLMQAMTRLQDRPVLFKYIIDEYCTARRSVLVRAFLDALTQGGPGGTPKPIEMHAHDPRRYVGDMLAWLHQMIPSEKENMLSLLRGCDKIDVMEHVQLALSNITEGVCYPLRVRIEQILATDSKATVLYAVYCLICFYHHIIEQVVQKCTLEGTLKELQEQSQQVFLRTLQNNIQSHVREGVESPPSDLTPSPGVKQILGLLKEVLSVASVTETEERQQDMAKIVTCVVDPLLQAVNESAARLPTCDMAVYLLNCLYQMQSTLSLYEFMDEKLEKLQAHSDAQIDTLTSEQASCFVANLNLGPIYTILQEQTKGPLSSVPGMEQSSLKNFLSKLENFVNLPDVFVLPQVNMLLSSSHRTAVQRRAYEVIAAIYRQLYEAVHNPANEYQNPDALMSIPPEKILEKLLG
ncbi:conserved oligomeric Golgi complex subunit 6 [Schistocerca piceifrons]|uniref:conserved oligomeric Golgi complex subunit 6 n=1 Tax=Schistocerca piceifrons TaxID=274613 RepID=UPI001F5F95A9|nr:conserved oligomeric Golgi complex subunit 6 [Schistocerca piceifrons]